MYNNKGLNIEAWRAFKERAQADPTQADREKIAIAHWIQGEEARVEIAGKEVVVGGKGDINMMEMILASLAACDAAVVAVHASYMGLEIKDLKVAVSGSYNVSSYIGVKGAPGPGFDEIRVQIYLDAPDATPDQITYLTEMCERVSPVGDTLTRGIAVDIEILPA